jgi:plasmid stability protein
VKIDERVKKTVRLPPPLNLRLQESAAQNGPSANAEIVRILRAALDGYRR